MLPLIDLSQDPARRVVIAEGTETVYQGHPTTALLPDGKTILVVWTTGHGGPCGPMARSTNGGLSWTPVATPRDWATTGNCPSLYRLADPKGRTRLFVFAATPKMSQTYSEDEGLTWSPVRSLGMPCVMAFSSIARLRDGRQLGFYHRGGGDGGQDGKRLSLWKAYSGDGGLTWGEPECVWAPDDLAPCEPCLVRSPDGKHLLCLIRENNRIKNALFMVSDDEGATWSEPRELTDGLSGDRHMACYSPDGRLVVTMRDTGKRNATQNHFIAWVGRYEDIVAGREGQCKVKLLHSHKGGDCGYSGLECLPDGTFVATTYIKVQPGSQQNSLVSVRFRLEELGGR
jgi:hypothetical protein